MTDLGNLSDVKALRSIFDPSGLSLIDVGCGSGDLARKLAYVGATVMGVEPDTVQAQKNAQADNVANVSFVEATAKEIPADPGSVDGVIFSLSLHHVPQQDMQASLDKARSLLKPGGFLAVVEPLLEGSYNDVIELFHDETVVRHQAIDAINRFATPHFTNWKQYSYTTETRYNNFSEFSDRYVNMTYNAFKREDVCNDSVRARFEANRDGDDYCLLSPMRIDFFTDSDNYVN